MIPVRRDLEGGHEAEASGAAPCRHLSNPRDVAHFPIVTSDCKLLIALAACCLIFSSLERLRLKANNTSRPPISRRRLLLAARQGSGGRGEAQRST